MASSTAAFQIFCLLNVASAPTVDTTVGRFSLNEVPLRLPAAAGTSVGRSRADRSTVRDSIIELNAASIEASQLDRETTEPEHIAGELRRWKMLAADWDGEGAAVPNQSSISEAVAFVNLLNTTELPSPMLHSSGRAGLFWKTARLYADIEFLGDARLAYYIERNGDKHKGVLKFDKKSMPAVLETILVT